VFWLLAAVVVCAVIGCPIGRTQAKRITWRLEEPPPDPCTGWIDFNYRTDRAGFVCVVTDSIAAIVGRVIMYPGGIYWIVARKIHGE